MKMTKAYFEKHVTFAIEFDYGYREWETADGVEELKKLTEGSTNLSDIDYCPKQNDEHVRKFLNIVDWNRYNNNTPAFKARIKGKSLDEIIDMALADGLEV